MICITWDDLLKVAILIGSILATLVVIWILVFLVSITVDYIKESIRKAKMTPEELAAERQANKNFKIIMEELSAKNKEGYYKWLHRILTNENKESN